MGTWGWQLVRLIAMSKSWTKIFPDYEENKWLESYEEIILAAKLPHEKLQEYWHSEHCDLRLPVWIWLYNNQWHYPANLLPNKYDHKETALVPERQVTYSSPLKWNLSLDHTEREYSILQIHVM
jgi:hypothetical protein